MTQADRGGGRPEDSVGGRQLQDSPRPDNPGVAGGEPSYGRSVFAAALLAASQSGGTARGLGPAAGPSRAEQDRSTASRQPGSCLPVFARSSGTGASLLSRGRLLVYSCLNSEDTTFDAISSTAAGCVDRGCRRGSGSSSLSRSQGGARVVRLRRRTSVGCGAGIGEPLPLGSGVWISMHGVRPVAPAEGRGTSAHQLDFVGS